MQIYPTFVEAKFIRRLNRCVIELTLEGKPIRAYVPNTGRMAMIAPTFSILRKILVHNRAFLDIILDTQTFIL
ncbi:hypothetical protein KKC74_10105 [bacterium]|nr:hypothetical protein [bacterium]MBU1065141.1 hypothetical protein [bacterium]MBU1872316.1 hypothetical protein [bacterium]